MTAERDSSAFLQESTEEEDAFNLTVEVTPRKTETAQQTQILAKGDGFIYPSRSTLYSLGVRKGLHLPMSSCMGH